MTNGMNPAPQQGFGQGWPQQAYPGQPSQPGQPGQPGQFSQTGPDGAGFDQNQFGGSRPFQQADRGSAGHITTDEAENIAAQRGEKVQETERRRARIWRNILGVLGLALLIACLMVLAWTYLPSPPVDITTAQGGLVQNLVDARSGAYGQNV